MRNILMVIMGAICMLTSCHNEEEKFTPLDVQINGQKLEQTGENEFTIPPEGTNFLVYSTEKNLQHACINWVEIDGVEYYPDDLNNLYNDEARYTGDWGEIIISSSVMPVKSYVSIHANTSGRERKLRFGIDYSTYHHRIISIIQQPVH